MSLRFQEIAHSLCSTANTLVSHPKVRSTTQRLSSKTNSGALFGSNNHLRWATLEIHHPVYECLPSKPASTHQYSLFIYSELY